MLAVWESVGEAERQPDSERKEERETEGLEEIEGEGEIDLLPPACEAVPLGQVEGDGLGELLSVKNRERDREGLTLGEAVAEEERHREKVALSVALEGERAGLGEPELHAVIVAQGEGDIELLGQGELENVPEDVGNSDGLLLGVYEELGEALVECVGEGMSVTVLVLVAQTVGKSLEEVLVALTVDDIVKLGLVL